MKFLKYLLAFLFGAFGGFFLYMDLAMILFRDPPGWFVPLAFFGGWGLITYWVLKGTETVADMLGKSFLVSAILSFGLSPAVLILSAKSVDVSGSDAQVAGSLLGGGLASGLGIGVSLFFTFVSLVGYGLVKLFSRESGGRKADVVDCSFCSEPIKKTARKCRRCGEFLADPKAQQEPHVSSDNSAEEAESSA